MANMMFGIHAAMTDGMLPLMENDVLKCWLNTSNVSSLKKRTRGLRHAVPEGYTTSYPAGTFLLCI